MLDRTGLNFHAKGVAYIRARAPPKRPVVSVFQRGVMRHRQTQQMCRSNEVTNPPDQRTGPSERLEHLRYLASACAADYEDVIGGAEGRILRARIAKSCRSRKQIENNPHRQGVRYTGGNMEMKYMTRSPRFTAVMKGTT